LVSLNQDEAVSQAWRTARMEYFNNRAPLPNKIAPKPNDRIPLIANITTDEFKEIMHNFKEVSTPF